MSTTITVTAASPTSPISPPPNPFTRSRFIIRRLNRFRVKSLNDDLCSSYNSIYSPEPRSLPPLSTASISTIPDDVEDEVFECCGRLEDPEKVQITMSEQCAESYTQSEVELSVSNTYPSLDVDEELKNLTDDGLSNNNEVTLSASELQAKDDSKKSSHRTKSTAELVDDLEKGLKRLEQMLMEISAATLLEEIEDILPEWCKLKNPLHGLKTILWYRTQERLSRVSITRSFKNVDNTNSSISPRQAVDEEIKLLREELYVRRVTYEQAKKARRYSTMSSWGSDDHLEAEKAQLVSKIRLEAAQKEMDYLEKAKRLNLCMEPRCRQVSIRSITGLVNDTVSWVHYHFVCIVVVGESVWESELERVNKMGEIVFEFRPQISQLRPSFSMFVSIYGIKGKEARILFQSKTPKKCNELHNFIVVDSAMMDFSHCRHRTVILPMRTRKLCDWIRAEVAVEVNNRLIYEGFLSVRKRIGLNYAGEELNIPWCRRWYRLCSNGLQGWCDPDRTDEMVHDDEISLDNYILHPASPAEPFSCIRPFTFTITYASNHESVCQLFASAESHSEMLKWCEHINAVLSFLQV